MQRGSAGSVCCLALLVAISVKAHNDFHYSDLKHTIYKRSSNDSDNLNPETNTDNNEQVSTTDVISLVHEVEKTDEEVKRVDRSGEYANAYRNLDSALKVAQAEPIVEVRTSSAITEAEPEAVTESIKADSKLYAPQNASLGHDLAQSEAPVVESTSLDEPDKANKQLRRGSGLYEPGYSRLLVPRSEMIYLDNVNGAENLVSCTREGELYKLQTPWRECLVCACMRERGRVQPVCVTCGNCAVAAPSSPPDPYPSITIPSIAPILSPTLDPQISIPQILQQIPTQQIPLQPSYDIEIPGNSKTCAPFPYGVPFDHPLNPCQTCVCQREYLRGNELFVTCKEDLQCVKQPEIPMLPSTLLPATPAATPLCEKFPKDVVFPHPTDACKICKCLDYKTSFGITEQQIFCNADPICGESLRGVGPKLYQPVSGPPSLVDFYPLQAKPELFPFGPTAPKQVYPSSPGWDVPQDIAYTHLSFPTPGPPPQMPNIIPAPPESFPAPSLSEILNPQEQIFVQEQNEPILIAEAVSFDANETPIPSAAALPPQVYPTKEPDYFFTKPTGIPVQPAVIQDLLPWPPLTIPAQQKQERVHGPLLGPPPHQSCQPYPANTPFQHPWDDCQLCVCAEFRAPGHVSIEVNCYTKSICCRTADSSPALGLEQLNIQSQMIRNNSPKIQLLDPMCELKTFGVEFPSPKDPCKVCSCHQAGSLVVPSCRYAESPFCKTKIAPALTGPITFIEPKCRYRAPEKPFVADCNVCVCHVVFTYVISKCTPQPKCINKLDGGNDIVDAQARALANAQSSYGQSYTNSIPLYQNQNLLLPSLDAPYFYNDNALSQLQGSNNYQLGQYQQSQVYEYRPQSKVSPAQGAANLLATLSQNSPVNVIKASASGQLGISPDNVQNNAQLGISPDNAQQLYWSFPQTTTTTTSTPVSSPSFISAQAFIDAINGPLQQNLQNPYYGQQQSGPEIIFEATSIVSPSNNYGYAAPQQTFPYQNFLRSYPDTTQANANAFSTTPGGLYSTTKSHLPYWNFQQPDASTWAPTEASQANYIASSNAYSYLDNSVTPFAQKTTPTPWDSSTLTYGQGDANALAQLQATADSGSIKGGRGQCQYAGDMYHHNCQACTCFSDETIGELYSMCSGKPCH